MEKQQVANVVVVQNPEQVVNFSICMPAQVVGRRNTLRTTNVSSTQEARNVQTPPGAPNYKCTSLYLLPALVVVDVYNKVFTLSALFTGVASILSHMRKNGTKYTGAVIRKRAHKGNQNRKVKRYLSGDKFPLQIFKLQAK